MFLILHKSRVCFVSSQVIDQWSYFNQNKSIVTSIMIRYSRQFISTISIISINLHNGAMFFAGFLICFDQPGSLLLSLFSPRASGTCSPCVAKGHGMAMCDEVASLVISEFCATKTWVRTAVCSKRLTVYTLLTLKDIKGLVPFPWHIKELRAAGISAVEPFCLDGCFGWEMATW